VCLTEEQQLPTPPQKFDVAILGAGPGGLSAAARAAQRGLSHILLEAAEQHANTIQRYQRRKHVMSEPSLLPLRSDLKFAAGRREEVLQTWHADISSAQINVRYRAEVTQVSRIEAGFLVTLKSGERISAARVVVALGVQGNPRRLGVTGDGHACIRTSLESADDVRGETILIVGAGDSAIENAVALSHANRVVLVNRGESFPRAKDANARRITKAIDAHSLECHFSSSVERVDDVPGSEDGRRCRVRLTTPAGVRELICDRVITRLGAIAPRQFIEPIGVRYVGPGADALPALSPRLETSIPGLFIVGALAGYPLIKQALNQGYEVVEYLCGNELEPADQALLASKLSALSLGSDVAGSLEAIRGRVRLFEGVSAQTLREIVGASTVRTLEAGNEIYLRGDYLDSGYNILQGVAFLYNPDTPRMTICSGQFIGALGLVSGRPSETTAIAGPDCVLLETPQRLLSKLIRNEPTVRAYVDRLYILRAMSFLLGANVPIQRIYMLARGARVHMLGSGDVLFQESEPAERVFLVRRGSVTLSRRTEKGDTVIAYCPAGSIVDPVGELDPDHKRTVTATATVGTECVSLDHRSFRLVLAEDQELARRLQEERAKQLAQLAHMQARPAAGDIMSFLMSQGVGEATNVLVIDESLCVGCDQCEKACAATHQGISRLDRRAGPTFRSLHLPTSCRHCEHPHCMSDCPVDAIHKLPNGEVSIDDSCIGCGNCEQNCPYGVIQMAEISVAQGFMERLLRKSTPEPVKTAVKCDMCATVKAGPACVNACPTGAAIRIHAEDVVQLAAKRATAA
jgi:Fe-S-cluster-containing dehydrogenase component/thioredoxin reductase